MTENTGQQQQKQQQLAIPGPDCFSVTHADQEVEGSTRVNELCRPRARLGLFPALQILKLDIPHTGVSGLLL